ncbi:MAG: ABC transporter substrate-binding protein [Angelakisella sp.]
MKKLRVLASVLALATTLSMVVGCGAKTPAASASSAPSQSASASKSEAAPESKSEAAPASKSEVPAEPVNLIWIIRDKEMKDQAKVWEELNKMSAKDIGVTVTVKNYNDQSKTKTALATGEDWDITFTCSWYNNFADNAQLGYYADLTDKLGTVAPTLKSYIPELIWKGAQIDGKIMAVPTYKDSAEINYWTFDKAWVDKTGYDITKIKTLQDLEPFMAACKKIDPAVTPYKMDYKGNDTFESDFDTLVGRSFGIVVKYGDATGKVISMYDDPGYIEDLKTIRSYVEKGYINADALANKQEPKDSIIWDQPGFPGAESIWAQSRGHEIVMNQKSGPNISTTTIRGSLNAINADSKNIDAALRYLEYANTNKAYRNMLAYGIEGTNYKLNEQGTVELLNKDYVPGAFTQASFFELIPQAPAKPDQWKQLKELMAAAPENKLVGFTFNYIDEFEATKSACDTIINKYRGGLTTGSIADIDGSLTSMREELKKAGYYDMITAAQKQVDAFLAASK